MSSAPMQVAPGLAIDRMRAEDIPEVQAIERQIFLSPWPKNAYATELSQNRHACYLVLRDGATIVGYGGLWQVVHEAHVTTVGVRSEDQRRGFGKVIFTALLLRAYSLNTRWVTLEVRTTNLPAIALYESFGFKAIGRRRGYYTDNGEDAVIMWSDSIHAPRFRGMLAERISGLEIAGFGELPAEEYPL